MTRPIWLDMMFGTGFNAVKRMPLYLVPYAALLIGLFSYWSMFEFDIMGLTYFFWDYYRFFMISSDLSYTQAYELMENLVWGYGGLAILGLLYDLQNGNDPFL